MWANLGELCAWLQQDEVARQRFCGWYNDTAQKLNVSKPPVDSDMVDIMARVMFEIASNAIRDLTGR